MTDQTTTTTAPATDAAAAPSQSTNSQISKNAPESGAVSMEPSSRTTAPAQAAPTDGAKDSAKPDAALNQEEPKTDVDNKSDQKSSNSDKADDQEDGNKEKSEEEKTGAPDQYEPFTMPEGIEFDTELFDIAAPILKELNVPQDKAQALADVMATALSKTAKEAADRHNAMIQDWRVQTEKTFGIHGQDEFNKMTGVAEEAINHFFPESERGIITEWGIGNHPRFFTMAYVLGKAMKEDGANFPAFAGAASGEETLGDIWYPSEKK